MSCHGWKRFALGGCPYGGSHQSTNPSEEPLVRRAHRTPLTLALLTTVTLATAGCADISGDGEEPGPSPAASLPAPLASLAKTDLGQYYVNPRQDASQQDIDGVIAYLKAQSDVVLVVERDNVLNITFRGNPKPDRKTEILRHVVTIGEVVPGI
jgi:hypothetical protein